MSRKIGEACYGLLPKIDLPWSVLLPSRLRLEDHSSLLHVDLKLSLVALRIGKQIRGTRSFWFIVTMEAARRYDDEAMQFITRRRRRYHKEDRRRAAFFRVYHIYRVYREDVWTAARAAVSVSWRWSSTELEKLKNISTATRRLVLRQRIEAY